MSFERRRFFGSEGALGQMAELREYFGALCGAKNRFPPGSWRVAYGLDDDWVLKVPHCLRAFEENVREVELYETGFWKKSSELGFQTNRETVPHSFKQFKDYFDSRGLPLPLAKCFLFYNGSVPLLKMERVDTDYSRYMNWCHKTPDGDRWPDFVDGQQVGFTKDGRLVCYDYNYWHP